jgi:hypothetical protein
VKLKIDDVRCGATTIKADGERFKRQILVPAGLSRCQRSGRFRDQQERVAGRRANFMNTRSPGMVSISPKIGTSRAQAAHGSANSASGRCV